ncbi:MAG: hypothetical protein JO180_04520 [Gemmatirosa sp.]|nr:hypothetical protein [Gemmatirosa sp.]
MSLSRAWLALAVPGALAMGVLLVRVVRSLVRTVRRAVVTRVPVPPPESTAHVDFGETGTFALSLETSRLTLPTARARELRVVMASETGAPLPVRAALTTTRVSSFDRVRIEIARVAVPLPGRYALRVGRPTHVDDVAPDAAIVVSRPVGGAIVTHVLALIALGAALIAAIVVSGLALGG